MSKTVSAPLLAHYASPVATLARLWQIVRRDGTIMGFTDHDVDIPFTDTVPGFSNKVTYAAATGFNPSAVKTNSTMAVDNLEVIGMLESVGITELDLQAGLYDYAKVLQMEVNYNDLTMGCMILRAGRLGEVTRKRFTFMAEVRGKTQSLDQIFGHLVTPTCNADLGDSRCKIALGPYTFTGSVTTLSGTSKAIFLDSAQTQVDHYFKFGLLTWTSGLNAGLQMEVKEWLLSSKTFTLVQGMPYAIQLGDAYSVYKGCSKILDDATNGCASFANTINFRGFPYVPGIDRLYQTPNAH